MKGRSLLIWTLGLSLFGLIAPLGLILLRGTFGAFWVFGLWAALIIVALILHRYNRDI